MICTQVRTFFWKFFDLGKLRCRSDFSSAISCTLCDAQNSMYIYNNLLPEKQF